MSVELIDIVRQIINFIMAHMKYTLCSKMLMKTNKRFDFCDCNRRIYSNYQVYLVEKKMLEKMHEISAIDIAVNRYARLKHIEIISIYI